MAKAATGTRSGSRQDCALPCGSCSGERCWKLELLTIVSLVLSQIYLYYNRSSFYDVHSSSVQSNSSMSQLKWFSSHFAPEDQLQSSVDSLGLAGGSTGNESEEEAGGSSTRIPVAETVQTAVGGDGNNKTNINNNPSCPPYPPKLLGRLQVNKNPPILEEQEREHPELTLGGHYWPENCTARHKVAIIIPYRNRESHLAAFVYHMHPFLQRQQVEYNIYVVEQAGNDSFNRGMLMNVGVLEALKQYAFDCLILHDVDLVPEDDRNLYTCSEPPRHMSVSISTIRYRLEKNSFGGVSAMTAKQYIAINGFSNKFWGWGGEDDDLFNRVKNHGLIVSRYPSELGCYTMFSHKKEKPSPDRVVSSPQIQKTLPG